ncbi:hypothetical protein [Methyloversatilis discipulorum]|uniref:hypothetical protein n=1 Tax=Methyloversatilis discipulorum TaxID=1119528 RepID=UPI000362C5C3|nr:hypothetical protein [Methyloversatilis discipulorum]
MSASDPKSTPPAAEAAKPELTAKQAAALVKRAVPQPPDEDGKPQPDKMVAVKAEEVLSHKVYEDGRVVVVTEDGQKFEGALKESAK